MLFRNFLVSVLVILVAVSCENTSTLPKPKGVLRLEYPQATYEVYQTNEHCPFVFDVNMLTQVKQKNHICDLNITYPKMNATIYISYKNIDHNLKNLLRDAQKFTFEHTIKADNIASTPFVNDSTKVYGMFYQVYGNAASQAQFYATDSVSHFISGSVYFNAIPNYDSIQPASHYLEKDVRKIMESLRWK